MQSKKNSNLSPAPARQDGGRPDPSPAIPGTELATLIAEKLRLNTVTGPEIAGLALKDAARTLDMEVGLSLMLYLLGEEYLIKPWMFQRGGLANACFLRESFRKAWRACSPEEASEQMVHLCTHLKRYKTPKAAETKAHAEEIFAHVEKEFGYFTELVHPGGLFIVAQPELCGASFQQLIRADYEDSGLMISLVLHPADSCPPERRIYEALAEGIVSACGTRLSEETLRLLSATIAPEIRELNPLDALDRFVEGLILGLSAKGSFAVDGDWPTDEKSKLLWHEYVSGTVMELAAEMERGRME